VIVSNAYGQAISNEGDTCGRRGHFDHATAGDGVRERGRYRDVYGGRDFVLPVTYQWYSAPAGSSTFTAISGATNATFTVNSSALADNGNVYKAVVSNGTSTNVTSKHGGFVCRAAGQVPDLCDTNWNAVAMRWFCRVANITDGVVGKSAWRNRVADAVATDNVVLSFTVTLSNPSATPADGFAVVWATRRWAQRRRASAPWLRAGAQGIPGLVFGFDTLPQQLATPWCLM